MVNKLENINPLVTINILSFNRKDELRFTLTKVFEQDYKNIEVIVVDNASVDGTQQMVKEQFPIVTLIELSENIGIAGWNKGFEIAKGEYVLVLDDDAYPSKNTIDRSLEEIRKDEKIACIAINIFDLPSNEFYCYGWLPKIHSQKKGYWPVFVGCAAFFRMILFPQKTFMPESYRLYQHELPVSALINVLGHKIFYSEDIIAFHNFKRNKPYCKKQEIFVFRNNQFFIKEYLPSFWKNYYLIKNYIFYLIRSIRKGWINEFLISRNEIATFSIRSTKSINGNYLFEIRKLYLFNPKLRWLFYSE